MFKLFNKHQNNLELKSIGNGEVIDLSEVEDPVFSQKMMGDGYGFKLQDGKVYSPVSGKITMVPDTKHGIGLATDDGMEILVHMGIDTVELKGEPFEVLVNEGDQVSSGDPIAIMDMDKITAAGKKTTTMVIVTNSNYLDVSANLELGTKRTGDLAATMVKN